MEGQIKAYIAYHHITIKLKTAAIEPFFFSSLRLFFSLNKIYIEVVKTVNRESRRGGESRVGRGGKSRMEGKEEGEGVGKKRIHRVLI